MDLRVINFPDKIFKNYLIQHFDCDKDGEISLTEALSITKVLCPNLGIKTLAGIEYFPNLKVLDCSRNKLESLDVSKNKKLEHLSCYNNTSMGYLDIRENLLLQSLYCRGCGLEYLDVSQNKELRILSCGFNSIGFINLEENLKLSMLDVRRCGLDELEVKNLTELQLLNCSENKLYELQLYENKNLTHLNCACNDLHNDLYLGANIKLEELECRKNSNLYSITISDGQYIKNASTEIKPMTSSYRQYLEWKEYTSEQLNDSWDDNEDWEDQRLDAFECDESNYWNID